MCLFKKNHKIINRDKHCWIFGFEYKRRAELRKRPWKRLFFGTKKWWPFGIYKNYEYLNNTNTQKKNPQHKSTGRLFRTWQKANNFAFTCQSSCVRCICRLSMSYIPHFIRISFNILSAKRLHLIKLLRFNCLYIFLLFLWIIMTETSQ